MIAIITIIDNYNTQFLLYALFLFQNIISIIAIMAIKQFV